MGVVQVSGRRAQGLQHRALERRQPERARQRPVVLHPPGQPAADRRRGVIGVADLPVRAGVAGSDISRYQERSRLGTTAESAARSA
jgi:hypothetical protein